MKYLLLLPSIILFLIFTIWPISEVIKLSVYKTNFITETFVGLDNYIAIFQDSDFLLSIVNSLLYAVILIPGQIVFSLFMALLIYNMEKHWIDVNRMVFYIPVLSAGIIIAQAWQWIFKFEGPVNYFLQILGLKAVNWFGQGYTAIPVISFIVMMSTFGGNVIILLASILSIDKSIFEAAVIDGATNNQIKVRIIIPMIKKTLILIGLLSAINAFSIFEFIFALVPQAFAATVTFNIYSSGFLYSKYGMAAAEAIILLIITISLSLLKKRVENE